MAGKPICLEETDQVMRCPTCHKKIGAIVKYGELELVMIGGLLVRNVSGVCLACKHEYHWSLSDQMLRKILASNG